MLAILLNKGRYQGYFSINFQKIFRAQFSKAVTQKYYVKSLFLKFLQNSKEKTGIRISFTVQKISFTVTFTEEILNGKLHFLCSIY